MKVKRKEGVRGIRIVEHNKKILYWIIGLVVLLVIVVFLIRYFGNVEKENNVPGGDICLIDSDCARASCCHASSCVIKTKEPNCEGRYCTQECVNGTLDCGQASCGCVDGKCSMVFNNLTSRR